MYRPWLRETWEHRDLLRFLIWRDLKVRYKQTVFGAAWALLQPLLLMIVFTIFLGRLAGVPSDGSPYAVFVYSALVPWTLFAQALGSATNSVVGSSNLVTKVYFPRLLLPLAAAASFIVDFLIALALLVVIMIAYGLPMRIEFLWVPVLALLAFVTSLAVGIWLAALNVTYRDVRHAIPFILQLWLFASPVAYPSSIVPPAWRVVYALNPMAGVVEGFRWALLGTATRPGLMLLVSTACTVLVLAGGIVYFQRVERSFSDII